MDCAKTGAWHVSESAARLPCLQWTVCRSSHLSARSRMTHMVLSSLCFASWMMYLPTELVAPLWMMVSPGCSATYSSSLQKEGGMGGCSITAALEAVVEMGSAYICGTSQVGRVRIDCKGSLIPCMQGEIPMVPAIPQKPLTCAALMGG